MAHNPLTPPLAMPVYGKPLSFSDQDEAPSAATGAPYPPSGAGGAGSPPFSASAPDTVSVDTNGGGSLATQQELFALKAKVLALEGENEELRRAVSTKRSRPMDSFAEALRGSIDGLQRQLGSMSNPTTDFAIKRFNLEANVLLDVSSVGSLVYRVVEPDETVEAHKLAKIAMEIVPVPKSSGSLSWDLEHFDPFQSIDQLTLPSFGALDQLRVEGLCTIGEFLQASNRARAVTHITQMLGIDRAQLANWRREAELLLIRGLNEQHLEVLRALGLQDIQSLSIQAAEPLTVAFNAKGIELAPQAHLDIDTRLVTSWLKSARAFVGHSSTSP